VGIDLSVRNGSAIQRSEADFADLIPEKLLLPALLLLSTSPVLTLPGLPRDSPARDGHRTKILD